jgi:hypothetical protein
MIWYTAKSAFWYFDLRLYPETDLFVSKMTLKFQLKKKLASRDMKISKTKKLAFFVDMFNFWDFISPEGNIFFAEIFRSFYSQTDLFEDRISTRNIEMQFLLYIRL